MIKLTHITRIFGDKQCWFKYEKNQQNHNNENIKDNEENQIVTQKMLDMMGKFTKHLIENA